MDLPKLIIALQGLRLSSYIDTGCLAILAYDYLLTFEDERTLIWAADWSPPKVLFLLARYFPFIDLPFTASRHFRINMTPKSCQIAYQIPGWLIVVGIVVSELILVVRTWAIWERTRLITAALAAWFSINLTADFIIMMIYMTSIRFSPLPSGLAGCLITSGNSFIAGSWIILLVFEAGILSLMVIKGIKMYRDHGSSTLYLAVFGNGAVFYVYIFTLSVANVIVISKVSRDLATMLASIERVTHAILTQRLLLTLRSTASGSGPDEWTKLETIRFDDLRLRANDYIDTEAETETITASLTLDWGTGVSSSSRGIFPEEYNGLKST